MKETKQALNKHWSLNEVEWNECADPMMDLLLDFDKISENGRNIYEWNKPIKQYSKLISIELSGMDEAN